MLHQEALDAEKEARMGKVKAEYAHESLYSALVRAEQRKEVVEKQLQSAVAFLMKTKKEKTALQKQVDELASSSGVCNGPGENAQLMRSGDEEVCKGPENKDYTCGVCKDASQSKRGCRGG
eukprot:3097742-Rhodomonas_salina.1